MKLKEERFSEQLRVLMKKAEIKNIVLAKALQFDVSYISKWTSGKILPAEKNITMIIETFVQVIVESCDENKMVELLAEYDIEKQEEFSPILQTALFTAYQKEKNSLKNDETRSENYYPVASLQDAIKEMDILSLEKEENGDVIVVIDLFSIDRESRLLFAGMQNRRFQLKKENDKMNLSVIINLDSLTKKDCIYDGIFLIHMLTSFSLINFEIYVDEVAKGKLAFAYKGQKSLTALLFDEKECISLMVQKELSCIDEIFKKLSLLKKQEHLAFRKTTMKEMLGANEYLQSIISTKFRWLLGHITEQFLPDNVFEDIIKKMDLSGEIIQEMKNTHVMLRESFHLGKMQIAIYESAVENFVMSGELDFYNHKVILTPLQRKQCIVHLQSLFQLSKNENMKMVEGGFSDDFLYITNPCLFMADTISYLRMENNLYKNNILIVDNKAIIELFEKMFKGIWNKRQDVVISDYEMIQRKLSHYEKSAEILSKCYVKT